MISGVSSFGFWAETVAHKCEGLVNVNTLSEYDDFRYVESEHCLVGHRSGRIFRIGDKVRIKVVAGNLEKRQLDYEWVMDAGSEAEAPVVRKKAKPVAKRTAKGPSSKKRK